MEEWLLIRAIRGIAISLDYNRSHRMPRWGGAIKASSISVQIGVKYPIEVAGTQPTVCTGEVWEYYW